MGGCCLELVTMDESTVSAKPFLDAIVMEDCESDGGLPDSPRTNESEWLRIFCTAYDALDQLVAPETGTRRWGRRFSKGNAMKT